MNVTMMGLPHSFPSVASPIDLVVGRPPFPQFEFRQQTLTLVVNVIINTLKYKI